MGQKGIEIVETDTGDLCTMLNTALSDEWLAYYQYWIGAKVMHGPMRSEIVPELMKHADQELNHAKLVADRILQLGGTPVLNPAEWFDQKRCPYGAPEDPYVKSVLDQNLDAERCAIGLYKDILDVTNGKDYATHQIVTSILDEELEHEQDIEDWITDLERMKDDIKNARM